MDRQTGQFGHAPKSGVVATRAYKQAFGSPHPDVVAGILEDGVNGKMRIGSAGKITRKQALAVLGFEVNSLDRGRLRVWPKPEQAKIRACPNRSLAVFDQTVDSARRRA